MSESKPNFVLFVQGNYFNQYISIGPKLLVNTETSVDFLKTHIQYYLNILENEQYEVEKINTIIFKFRTTDILHITQPSLPKINNESIKPILPKQFMYERYFPASMDFDLYATLVGSTVNSEGQETLEYEYNQLSIFQTKISDFETHNVVAKDGITLTTFDDKAYFNGGAESKEPYFVRTINKKLKLYYKLKNKE